MSSSDQQPADPRSARLADPDRLRRLAAARARTVLENRRGTWRLDGVAVGGRAVGRLAARLDRLPRDLDPLAPVLAPLTDEQTGARVFAAAAAALTGHQLALAVTPQARAAADTVVGPEARSFALARRHLSLPLADAPLPQALAVAEARIRDAWHACLPPALAAEMPPMPPVPAPLPEDVPQVPQKIASRLAWLRRRPAVLPADPDALPVADRPARALDAALASLVGVTRP